MVFVFRNAVCRHSIATDTQFTFTSYRIRSCFFIFFFAFFLRDTRCSHTSENSKYYFIVNSKDKQEFEKRNKQIVHRHIFIDIPYIFGCAICLLRYFFICLRSFLFIHSIYAVYTNIIFVLRISFLSSLFLLFR